MSAPCPILGFVVRVTERSQLSASAVRAILLDAVADNGLEVQPMGDRPAAFALTREGSQATEADRQLVIRHLEGKVAPADVHVSDIVDLAPDV
jgi:hypothetical protein